MNPSNEEIRITFLRASPIAVVYRQLSLVLHTHCCCHFGLLNFTHLASYFDDLLVSTHLVGILCSFQFNVVSSSKLSIEMESALFRMQWTMYLDTQKI